MWLNFTSLSDSLTSCKVVRSNYFQLLLDSYTCDSLLTINFTRGQESDEDSNIQKNLHDETAVRKDAGASRACTEVCLAG